MKCKWQSEYKSRYYSHFNNTNSSHFSCLFFAERFFIQFSAHLFILPKTMIVLPCCWLFFFFPFSRLKYAFQPITRLTSTHSVEKKKRWRRKKKCCHKNVWMSQNMDRFNFDCECSRHSNIKQSIIISNCLQLCIHQIRKLKPNEMK